MKLLNSTIKLTMIAVVVSIVSMMTTFVMVNIYADKLFQQFDLGFQHPEISMNELILELTDQQLPEQERIRDDSDDIQIIETVEEADPETIEVWNQQAERQLISIDDFNRLKDQISDDDKMKVFSLAISNIPPQQIHAFSHILENGITEQELLDLDEMLQQHLDADDYLDLMSILSKYE